MEGSNEYLKWLSKNTATSWWHDSAEPCEILEGIANGAVGITTNPLLIRQSLYKRDSIWAAAISDIPKDISRDEKAEEIVKRITVKIAEMLEPIFRQTAGKQGYVCAQVNPKFPGDVDKMLRMAKRLSQWAPNIAVKLPATASGLDVLEECAAEGLTLTATVSFTVPQVIAIAERYRKGIKRAEKNGIKIGRCFAVVMTGRIDDYLRDVAYDRKALVEESDIIWAGTAIIKRAYEIFEANRYEAVLMSAGMRGAYHATELAGGNMVLSVHPKIQAMISKLKEPFEENIRKKVDDGVIRRLKAIPEFIKAYEPEGMKPVDFITYGVVQKTLSQFVDAGWVNIEEYVPN